MRSANHRDTWVVRSLAPSPALNQILLGELPEDRLHSDRPFDAFLLDKQNSTFYNLVNENAVLLDWHRSRAERGNM
jgi:hypothetical protein